MQDGHSHFFAERSALPPGPAVVTGRSRIGVLLLTSFLACAGAASLWARTCHLGRSACATGRVTQDAQPPQLNAAQRAQLSAERARLLHLLDGYEDAMERGEGCSMGFMKYRLEVLRIDEKLTDCGYERAHLQRQIAHLEALRARMLTGYGEMQGPAGHDE